MLGIITLDGVLTQVLNGCILGLIYVAIAVGLTIVFGMLRLVNFAHGAFYTLGAYAGLVAAQRYGLVAGLIFAPLAVALIAIVLDRVLLRLFYEREPTAQIMVTFGIALVVEEVLRFFFGGSTIRFPIPDALSGSVNLGFVEYPAYRLILAAGIIAMIMGLWLFIQRTNYGLIVRAGVRDRMMVQLLGGNVQLASTIIFAIGAGLAGLVGAASSPIYSVAPETGFNFLIPSFVVVVVGGLGSFWGAVLGGLIVGELQSLTTLFVPAGSEVVIYIAMAIVLLVRPSGLLGESEVIKG